MLEPPFRRVHFDLSAGRMAGIASGDPDRPPQFLFLHAAGFNALTYRDLLAPLAARFSILAVDLRGHGRTTLPAPVRGYASWNRHRDDVAELIEDHLGGPVVAGGHSMGATVALLLSGARPDLVRGLSLIEPVLITRLVHALALVPGAVSLFTLLWDLPRHTLRRAASFGSKAEALNALRGHGPFAHFNAQALADYVEDGFIETETGVTLACTPSYEARSYLAHRYSAWGAFRRAPPPIVVQRSERKSTCAPATRLLALRPDAEVATIEKSTHLLPFERPDRAREAIDAAVSLAGAPKSTNRPKPLSAEGR